MTTAASLARQVRRNCTISDARFAGIYSVCGLAMRLRDLYKWEHSLPAYEEHEAARVLDWIGRKEALWEVLQGAEFDDLVVAGQAFDPFDTALINRRIAGLNLFYGAGYAQGLKPTFFLAEIAARRRIDGHPMVTLSTELARDLLTLPALSQEGTIVVRQSAAALYAWDQMLYMGGSGKPYYYFALAACGLDAKDAGMLQRCLPAVIEAQQDVFIYHEIGEMSEGGVASDMLRHIVSELPHSASEFLVRAVKDMLADTCPQGTLPQLIRTRRTAALGFYAAFLEGLAKALFPEVRTAVADFMQNRRWLPLETAIQAVHRKARDMADTIAGLYGEGLRRDDLAWMAAELEDRYIRPLTP